MGAARSVPPPAPSAPLRAKSLGKLRLPARQHAREVSARSLAAAAAEPSTSTLGAHLGGEFAGAQIRTGALVLTPAEVALLLPLPVALAHLSDVLRERIVCELASPDCTEERALRLRLALIHVDALCVVSAA